MNTVYHLSSTNFWLTENKLVDLFMALSMHNLNFVIYG